jgi:hypothetical protein
MCIPSTTSGENLPEISLFGYIPINLRGFCQKEIQKWGGGESTTRGGSTNPFLLKGSLIYTMYCGSTVCFLAGELALPTPRRLFSRELRLTPTAELGRCCELGAPLTVLDPREGWRESGFGIGGGMILKRRVCEL